MQDSDDDLNLDHLANEGRELSRRCVTAALQGDWQIALSQITEESPVSLAYCVLFQSSMLAAMIKEWFPSNAVEEWADYLMEVELRND
jgi:hypothetical protein